MTAVVVASLRRDHRGIANKLKSPEVDKVLGKYADRIAQEARRQVDSDVPIEQASYTTDRAARAVTIAHPAGIAIQARHGVLTKAAAAAGLEAKKR